MDSHSGRDSHVRGRPTPDEVTVVNWPLRDEARSAWGVLAAAGGLACLVGWKMHSALAAFAAATILWLILWRVWLPVAFEFRRHGLVQVNWGRRRRIPWASISHYEVQRSGVLLLPTAAAGSLAPLRGLFVTWGGRRSAILAVLEFYLGSTSPSGHSTTASAESPLGQ